MLQLDDAVIRAANYRMSDSYELLCLREEILIVEENVRLVLEGQPVRLQSLDFVQSINSKQRL